MGSSDLREIRSLPRFFGEKRQITEGDYFELSKSELNRLRNVLRLRTEDQFGLLLNDGKVYVSRLDGNSGVCVRIVQVQNEPKIDLTLALALSKPDAMESALQMCTEIGVSEFLLFPTERSVVQWDDRKTSQKLERFDSIVSEAATVALRFVRPRIKVLSGLAEVLHKYPQAQVASERDDVTKTLEMSENMVVVIGPEGGWAPREVEQIGDHAFTLGSRVLRVATAAAAVTAIALSDR